MSVKFIDSLILYAADLKRTCEFYSRLGVPLEEEKHGDGPVHFAGELGSAHIAVFAAKPGNALKRGEGGATQIGFRVDSVEKALASVAGAKVLIPLQEVPWGKRAVIEDPDGRPVELNQS